MLLTPLFSAGQLSNPGFSGDELLRIAELEACLQDFSVRQVSETG
jgi:hypothetical protein